MRQDGPVVFAQATRDVCVREVKDHVLRARLACPQPRSSCRSRFGRDPFDARHRVCLASYSMRSYRHKTHGVIALVAMQPFVACGARSDLDDGLDAAARAPGYQVLFARGAQSGMATLFIWHSSTQAVSTVGTYALDANIVVGPAFTPSGQYIALQVLLGKQPKYTGWELDIIEPNGTLVRSQVQPLDGWTWLAPALRPDAERVLVGSSDYDLGVLDIGGMPTPLLSTSFGFTPTAAYSPDGVTIVFVHNVSTPTLIQQIETMRDDGTERTVVVPIPADGDSFYDPTFSFDGKSIVYLKCDNHPLCDVDVVDVDSLVTRTLYSGANTWASPHFTPDSSGIVIIDQGSCERGCMEVLRRIDVATSETTVLNRGQAFPAAQPFGISVAID